LPLFALPARSSRPSQGEGNAQGKRHWRDASGTRRCLLTLLVLAATCAPLAAQETPPAPADEVEAVLRLVGGEQLTGQLVALDDEQAVLETPDGRREVDADTLLGIDVSPDDPDATDRFARPGVWIELTDGSLIAATKCVVGEQEANIELVGGASPTFPSAAVRAVRFSPPTDAINDAWRTLLDEQHTGDMLVIRRGDALDYHRGVVETIGEEKVRFNLDGDVLPVPREKLHGVAYLRSAPAPGGEIGTIVTRGGSRWSVRSLRLNGKLQWTTPAGVTVREPLARLESIDFSGGKVVYLSDLEPRSIDWRPYMPLDTPLESRRALFRPRWGRPGDGVALRLDGHEFDRGVLMHSRGVLVYLLPEAFQRLQATVGIGDDGRPHGDAVLHIEGDGRQLLELHLRGTDPPQEVDVDLTGVRRLTVTVDYGQGMDIGDQVILAKARLLK